MVSVSAETSSRLTSLSAVTSSRLTSSSNCVSSWLTSPPTGISPKLNIIYLTSLLLVACLPHAGGVGGFQRFLEVPRSVEVGEGDDVTLPCVVENQQGRAQWTKDGFALGFLRKVPGYPRFTYLGDPGLGQHHLFISSVTIKDDGEYQCQVGPTFTNPPIWAAANLTVLLPPTSLKVEGGNEGSVVEVRAGDTITLRCQVNNARPPSSIMWYLGDTQVNTDQEESQVMPSSVADRWNVRSQVVLRAKAEDDGKKVTCRAVHPALQGSAGLVATRTLAVFHPPDRPVISGYATGEALRAGVRRSLTCRVSGGNPRPSLFWYRDGRLLDDTYSRDATSTINIHDLVVTAAEDGAKYECHVSSRLLEQQLEANVTLTVHYPPSEVRVRGPSRAEAGTSVSLRCDTSQANPPASLTWLVQGEEVASPGAVVSQVRTGGWISWSRLVQQVDMSQLRGDQLQVVCRAEHSALNLPIDKKLFITVIRPAEAPVFEGHLEREVIAGTSLDLVCSIVGGHPPPSVKIYKQGLLVPTEVTQEGSVTRARSRVEVIPADNGAEVKCEVISPTSVSPKVTATKLSVLFAPQEVTVSAEPSTAEMGGIVTVSCHASPSLPQANITWRSGGVPLKGALIHSAPAAFGGTSTRSEVQLRTTAEDNGRVLVCEADNGVGAAVHKKITLNVLHPPLWVKKPAAQLNVGEGAQVVVTATAVANPLPVRYWWRRDRETLVSAGGELRLGRITRDMAGNYTVSAYSQRGAVNTTFFINVHYGPEDVKAPERVTLDEGDSVNVQCSATGNPPPHLTWTSRNHTLSSGVGVARLMLTSARRENTGVYQCSASSPLASPPPVTTKLIVTQPVSVAREMASTHGSWVALGKRGRLVCHVRAAPPPSFTWTTEDVRNIHNNEKYTIHKAKLLDELVLWASVLEVEVITQHDYRDYHCSASNDLGTDSTTLTLMPPTHPRPPANFTMVNVSDVSVVLGWSPNLDAGMPHSFTVRYRADGTLDYEYKEADGGSTGVRVEGLSPGVRYTFSVKADNDQGSSDYSTPAVTVTTLGTSISSGHRLTSYLLLVIIMSAMALLVLNVAIIACILQRHKKKKKHPSRCKASSSTKTTSVTTQGGGNTSTSSPEDHHHLHHHHHILKGLKSRSSKTTEAYQAEHHNNKGRGQNTNLPRPSASGQTHKSSANKNPKTVRKWTGTLKRRGRIPDTVHLHTQEINKPDSTLSRNRLFGNGRLPNHSKEIVPSTASPEASSLIPRLRDNITPQLQQRNSVLDDDQTSDSSHESTDTAIFCDNSASSPQPSGQTHSHTPKEHDALSYAQQIKEDLQQHERSENIQQALQHGQSTKQTTQTDSFITLTGAHSSTYHQQQNNYHQAYVSEGAGRDSRPRSNIDSLLAQSITQGQPDRRGNIHTSPRTSRSGILHQQRPNSSPTGALRHHTPDRQQHLPPSSPIIRIQHHKMQLTSPTRVQHRQIVNDSPTKIQKGQLRSDSPTRVQHRQLPLSSPDRDQFRRLLEDSLTKVQHRQLTPDPPPRGQHRRLPTDSPSVVQKHHPARPTSESQKHHSLLADPPTEVQHRPPPVPQSPTRHRSPPTRPKLRYHRPPTPPKLRHHPPPTPPKPSPAQYSPSSKIRHLGQIDKSDNQSISIPEVYQLPHYTDDPNAEDNIIASSAILDSSHQDSTQRAYQLAQNDSCTSQGNMLVSQSLSQVVHAMRETQAPVATSSPITRPRRSRFPDDFIWHGNPGKS